MDIPSSKINGSLNQSTWNIRAFGSALPKSIRAGNFDFILIIAHIRWGSGKKSRIRAPQELAEWIGKCRKHSFAVDKDIILSGASNIPSLADELYQAIGSKGLNKAKAVPRITGPNLEYTKRYDQSPHY